MELMVGPKRARRGEQNVTDFLQRFPNMQLVELDFPAAVLAAEVRAKYGFKSPDALIIGTARSHDVAVIVTNDGAWGKKITGAVVILRSFITA